MDLRLVMGQHPSLIIIGSTAMMFKGTEPGEAILTGAASSMVTHHNTYIEVRKSPQYGTWDSYIEGYRYGTSPST